MRLTVVGAGKMGAGLGLTFARPGTPVRYLVRDPARAERAVRAAEHELVELGVLPETEARELSFHTDIGGLAGTELLIESVPEDHELKSELLGELSRALPNALLFSNTSSLPVSELARGIADPGRFAAMHFWHPPALMPLVEVVPGEHTAPETVARATEFLEDHGKVVIRLAHDLPGFVWNRLVVAVLREAKSLVDAGVVGRREIDLVVEHGLARRWSLTGPFASASIGGLTTFETIGANLAPLLDPATDLRGFAAFLDGYVEDVAALDAWRNQLLASRPDPAIWPITHEDEVT